jgi:hypothetical protein
MMNMALSGNMVFGCFWIFLCMNIYEPTLLGLETAAKAAHMQQSRQATARKVENSNPTRMVLNCYCAIIFGGSYTSMIIYVSGSAFVCPQAGLSWESLRTAARSHHLMPHRLMEKTRRAAGRYVSMVATWPWLENVSIRIGRSSIFLKYLWGFSRFSRFCIWGQRNGLGNTGNHTRNMPRQCLGKGPILAG